MSTHRDPARRIPKNLGGAETLYGFEVQNIGVAAIPFGVGLIITNNFQLPQYSQYLLPITGLLMGLLILFFTPDHLTSREWIESYIHYVKQPGEINLEQHNYDMAREESPSPETEGEVGDIFAVDTDTKDLTHVERVHRDAHAIERDDGTVVGAVKVDPANMALASNRLWEQMVDEFESYLDNVVDYKIQIYATTRRFPVEDYVQHYEQRLNDPDVKRRPILQELLADYLSWYPEYLNYQGTNQREYYIIVTVDRDEIYGIDRDEKSMTEKLAELPGVGSFFESFLDRKHEMSETGKLQEQLRELNSRCQSAERHGAQSMTGVSARRVSGAELAVLLKEYWEGREMEMNAEEMIRNGPVTRKDGAVSTDEVSGSYGYSGTTEQED